MPDHNLVWVDFTYPDLIQFAFHVRNPGNLICLSLRRGLLKTRKFERQCLKELFTY